MMLRAGHIVIIKLLTDGGYDFTKAQRAAGTYLIGHVLYGIVRHVYPYSGRMDIELCDSDALGLNKLTFTAPTEVQVQIGGTVCEKYLSPTSTAYRLSHYSSAPEMQERMKHSLKNKE